MPFLRGSKRGITGDSGLRGIVQGASHRVSGGHVGRHICFPEVFPWNRVSEVIGSNPEVIISIVNSRIDVISFLGSMVFKKWLGKSWRTAWFRIGCFETVLAEVHRPSGWNSHFATRTIHWDQLKTTRLLRGPVGLPCLWAPTACVWLSALRSSHCRLDKDEF